MEWFYDNRAWLFEGIGVVILVAIFTWLWRKQWPAAQERREVKEPSRAAGVTLDDVTVKKKATIRGVQHPERGLEVNDSTFGELDVSDIAVGQSGSPAGAPSTPIVGSQYTNVKANTLTSVVHVHPPQDASHVEEASLRHAYLGRIFSQADLLPLTGVDIRTAGSADTQLQLSAVYTALLTQTAEIPEAGERTARRDADQAQWDSAGDSRRMSAVAQLDRHARLVLLGGPGSGKSTFVNFVAMCMAGTLLQNEVVNLALLTAPLPAREEDLHGRSKEEPQPQPWSHGAPLPVRVVLRQFAARGLPPGGRTACADDLWQFICTDLEEASLGAYAPYLQKELLEQGGILMLDGLDEVPEADERRAQIKQAVSDFAATYKRCRILVTSRTYAYQNQDWRLGGFAEAALQPFSRRQIESFVDRWYAHVAPIRHLAAEDAQGRAQLLKQRILNNDRLYALAEQPLLLTLMASLHAWRGGSLPERRVELYADAVELLLDRWENQRVVRTASGAAEVIQPSLVEFLKIDRAQLMDELYRLAYEVHAMQPGLTGTADIAQKDLVEALLKVSGADVKPKLLIDYLSNRAGLLSAHGSGVYQFPHRTFQEYLAACHLTDDEFPDRVAELGRSDPNRWREVVLLAGAKAAGGTPASLWMLAEALCYPSPGSAEYGAADQWGALLAGQALVESGLHTQVGERNRPKLERVRSGNLHALRGDELPAVDRALAGQVLAKLGDVRVEVLDPLRMEFCLVPSGRFVMGTGSEQHEYDISYDYWIGRYPVTVAQYAAFVAAGGYKEEKYWGEARKEGFWEGGKFRDRDEPYRFGEPFDLPNHPVVGVSWYEALAYVRWLDAVSTGKPQGLRLSLASEPEWEKAARGGLEVVEKPVIVSLGQIGGIRAQVARRRNELAKRKYPWGDEPDPERANYDDTKIGSTSAVGCFARGSSPYGVEEMSGNAWEWTRSVYDKYPYPSDGTELGKREQLSAGQRAARVLRGGAFDLYDYFASCAARFGSFPNLDHRYNGFRVVLSPFTSGR